MRLQVEYAVIHLVKIDVYMDAELRSMSESFSIFKRKSRSPGVVLHLRASGESAVLESICRLRGESISRHVERRTAAKGFVFLRRRGAAGKVVQFPNSSRASWRNQLEVDDAPAECGRAGTHEDRAQSYGLRKGEPDPL